MTSANLDPLLRLAARVAPRSLVARTTAIIFALALMLGLVFALASARIMHRREDARLQTQMQQLLSAVSNTAQIACYLKDQTLARDVATGLMHSDAVSGVRIEAGGKILYQTFRRRFPHGAERLNRIVRAIDSPFDGTHKVGSVALYLSRAQLRNRAWSYTRFILVILAAEVAVISAGTALVVFLAVTHPIKRISDELHRLRGDDGALLRVPAGNASDEIGRLVTDVNSLILRLDSLVGTERNLRIRHELAERKLRLVLNQTEVGICTMDAHGALQGWNPALVRLLALPAEPAIGALLAAQRPLEPHTRQLQDMFRCCLLDGQSCESDFEIHEEAKITARWIELSINPIGPDLLLGVMHDITSRKQSVAVAQQLAMRDPLTGLLNRRGLDAALARLFDEGVQPGALALLAIDLDLFKQINDSYGHEAGDTVLRHVGGVIETTVRGSDVVGRIGGDEFIAVLVGAGHVKRAQEIAAAIVASLSRAVDIDGLAVKVGASVGIASSRGPEDSPAALLRRADAAMYTSKQSGRGRICVAPPEAA